MPLDEQTRAMIELDREEMLVQLASVERLLLKLQSDPLDEDLVVALGAYVHGLYQGVENILKRVAAAYGTVIPKSDRWHADLLDLFTAGAANALLPFFNAASRSSLDEMRGFRHVFRVHYATRISWTRLKPVATACKPVIDRLFAKLSSLA